MDRKRLNSTEVEATIRHAEAPLDLRLKLLSSTGMRYGEAASLRAEDLDVATDEIAVRKRGSFAPKTENSERTVTGTPALMSELNDQARKYPKGLFPSPYPNE